MIQSRKNLIEDAFYKARGLPTKVSLIQQKDDLIDKKNKLEINRQVRKTNEIKVNSEDNQNNSVNKEEIKPKNSIDKNSIDTKAKQFAEFFNGEIVNLEETN